MTKLFIVLSVLSVSTAFAQFNPPPMAKPMTKAQALRASAKAVVLAGNGPRIDGCSSLTNRDRLIACVLSETKLDGKVHKDGSFWKLAPNAVLTQPVHFSYLDTSGDCALITTVYPLTGRAEIRGWDCY